MVLNEESFEDIHEFTDIARPVVADEIVQECRANGWHTNPEPGGKSSKQELNQARKIFPSISKRRHLDANHIQPKKRSLRKRSARTSDSRSRFVAATIRADITRGWLLPTLSYT